MEKLQAENDVYEGINKALDKTSWLDLDGNPRKIKIQETSTEVVTNIMNHYRSAGWIVKASLEITTTSGRGFTLEFINPYHQ